MKILLTGATGFIGRNLFSSLQKEHDVYVLTRTSSDVSCLSPKHHYIFEGDIEHLANYIESEGIEGVIHLATMYVAEHKESQIRDLILTNVYLGTAILDAASRSGVKWFLNIGTIWQNYNAPDYSDEYHPANFYAATKQAFMTMAKFYVETTPIRFCTLKLCDTYGAGDTRRKVMNLFSEIAQTGESLDMSAGEQMLDIVPVSEVVTAICHLIELISDSNQNILSEYVVTSGKQISLKQLATQYEKEKGVKLNINWGAKPYRKREVMIPYRGNQLPLNGES